MKNNKNKIKGFTLVELLISVGLISLATVGIYAASNVASDWRKSSQEVKSLNSTIVDVNNSISTTGIYTGVTLSSLKNMSINVNSALDLSDVNSPSPRVLHFVYNNVNPRVCNDFSSKMLSSSKNIGVIINGVAYNENNISNIVGACNVNNNSNDVTVVLNQEQNNFTVTDVVASVNLPLPPPPDIMIPSFPPPAPPIVIPPFVTPPLLTPAPILPAPPIPITFEVNALICTSADPFYDYNGGESTVPLHIRNRLISTYKAIPNHLGRCAEQVGYFSWIDRIIRDKPIPVMDYYEWENYYVTRIEPDVVYAGTYNFTVQQQIDGANTACNQAAIDKYPSLYPHSVYPKKAVYVFYSGSKCEIR